MNSGISSTIVKVLFGSSGSTGIKSGTKGLTITSIGSSSIGSVLSVGTTLKTVADKRVVRSIFGAGLSGIW
ncbi:MAG: hypothetical protein CO022_03625 [Flavobacteriales bacterium CG_4_9_14_0_2_um_filter_32_27]|nr:MAG: hypothetical protein CO022_03625 [Flavobacteriales bacterium CG_4_9_14_0_2_um_filter_32_27]